MKRPDTKLVGELGTNHNGDMGYAAKLVDHLAAAGFWAAKGQYRTPREEWKQKDYSEVGYSFGSTYYAHRHAIDLSIAEHKALAGYCRDKGLLYYVSVWDVEGVEVALDIAGENGNRYVKLPSALNNNEAILRELKRLDAHVIMSTGMLDETGLRYAVRIFGPNLCYILITTCAYPAKDEDLNLCRIRLLVNRRAENLHKDMVGSPNSLPPWVGAFGVGFSGHHLGTDADVVAVAQGATMIERHVTLDHRLKGPDHKMSLEPRQIAELGYKVQIAEEILGKDIDGVMDCEIPFARKVGRFNEEGQS
jgi:N-acetylneuraminate synthase